MLKALHQHLHVASWTFWTCHKQNELIAPIPYESLNFSFKSFYSLSRGLKLAPATWQIDCTGWRAEKRFFSPPHTATSGAMWGLTLVNHQVVVERLETTASEKPLSFVLSFSDVVLRWTVLWTREITHGETWELSKSLPADNGVTPKQLRGVIWKRRMHAHNSY